MSIAIYDDEQTPRHGTGRLIVKSFGESHIIIIGQIRYIESHGRKNIIHLADGVVEYYGSMSELEDILPSGFNRIHKGYIVNMRYIDKYTRQSVTLRDGEELLVSKYRYTQFVNAYMDYIKSKP